MPLPTSHPHLDENQLHTPSLGLVPTYQVVFEGLNILWSITEITHSLIKLVMEPQLAVTGVHIPHFHEEEGPRVLITDRDIDKIPYVR